MLRKIPLIFPDFIEYNLEGCPPQGLSEARRGREVFEFFLVTDPPRGRPFGGGGVHHYFEKSSAHQNLNIKIYPEMCDSPNLK